MSTPLDHPLQKAIEAMSRATDALVELRRSMSADSAQGIGQRDPNSEAQAKLTKGNASPSPVFAFADVECVRSALRSDHWAVRESAGMWALNRIADKLAQQDEQLKAEYNVRRMVLHALEGQGLPTVMPKTGHGVIADAHRLYQRANEAEERLEWFEALALTEEEVAAVNAFWSYGATRGNHSDEGRGPSPGPLTPHISAMSRANQKLLAGLRREGA